MLTLAEIPSFQKFLFYCPTAQMAEVMVQNVAYRATVYITGIYTYDYLKASNDIELISWMSKPKYAFSALAYFFPFL